MFSSIQSINKEPCFIHPFDLDEILLESIDLFPIFNRLDDFFSQWIPDDILDDFCSSLDDFCIATADPLYENSDFLLTCVHFSLL